MPRRYKLRKRQDQKAATRDRIVVAAAELFRVKGVTHTSMAQVAAAADVAPGTIHNHFASTDDLATAVANYVMARLRMPGPDIFDGVEGAPARVTALARAMAAYYERSQPWYRMAELDDRPIEAWSAGRVRYEAEYEALVRTALGPGTADDVVGVVAAMLGPGVFVALRGTDKSMVGAADTIGRVLAPWLEATLVRR